MILKMEINFVVLNIDFEYKKPFSGRYENGFQVTPDDPEEYEINSICALDSKENIWNLFSTSQQHQIEYNLDMAYKQYLKDDLTIYQCNVR